ncbi:MAG: carboxypeptidase regulatory-like domain-containing protein [Verrucomicrobia bacterium]|nr:carboxypeptidase regulatory-like domain-containing protein [Verrucomicrobiota bacterium]
MKARKKIIVLVALISVLGVVWLLNRKQSASLAESLSQATQKPAFTPPPPIISKEARQQPGGPYAPADPRWADRQSRREADPLYEWKTPIEFYGKVLDQDGSPVAGATVDVIWTDLSANGSSHLEVVSDGSGLFSIKDIRGKHMTVQVTKEGYQRQLKGGQSGFDYAGFWEPTYHEPDANNPVIFRLRKKVEADPMIQRGPTFLGASNDGAPTSFDLATGRKAADGSGNIAVRITKGPKTDKRFDWTTTVEGIGGAELIESTDEFMTTAPVDGYKPRWTFSQKATDEKYQSEVQAKFYVKTGDGRYARVEMRILPEYNETAAVDLTVYLNPSGSRNLEFDRKKVVKSP